MKQPLRTLLRKALLLAIMAGLGLVFAMPLAFMFAASFKGDTAVFENLAHWSTYVPGPGWSMDNYRAIFQKSDLPRFLLNSTIVAVCTVVAGVFLNSMLAFALARMRWGGRHVVLGVVVALVIVPFEVIAIPLLSLVAHLPWPVIGPGGPGLQIGWFNSLHVQIIPFVANAFCTFLFYQFFRDIPAELDEAAKMDGAGPWTVYLRIIMPNSGPVIATAAIILFVGAWNQYLWPIMVIQSEAFRPVQPGIQQFFGRTNSWGQIMAYASVITLPVLAVFLAFQRQFVASVAGSGIKG
ncbi:carbohydrate ABC transporter permease [Pseudoduganella albidiflava]|uniref:Carbohydrate ABC transporter permease n=1 Tax=Pseudoduganella albidiflava TaxID=321983 RepID=A0A411WVY5_9BURK|nr:carbohydrate ABC transporter permease [Pseudoduganella albidiflava]QBI00762.1 carbohydrate ABC transporter permease [Pseudoduganella albidiflava]GGY30897.1 sn-glycerol-3-phosphate transport system permease protein UgpE [Pseudoduganella albidiflava]